MEGKTPATEFKHEGLQNWLAIRSQWTKTKMAPTIPKQEVHINPDALYEELLATDKDGKLSQRVPLPELISVIAEVWEADGLAL
ncbi:hypothetical protein PROFUN_10156 [Planoprotostelium fungivorum]|uniref:DUF4050 domain-containing protein n=1 Tax=Planoprotostelium fungivorum TaxID=1890364 RepID=A0A2P6NEK3_9EUKA|nr:hypothetical protein PROFUN_10156 [Planoprotostelium fungivorum]